MSHHIQDIFQHKSKHHSTSGAMSTPTLTPLQQNIATNVQGDVVLGLQKRVEAFVFFGIQDAAAFRPLLKTRLVSEVTSTGDVQAAAASIAKVRSQVGRVWLPNNQFNIAFSATGLVKLGVDPAVDFPGAGNAAFRGGQQADALANLADPQDASSGLATWKPVYTGRKIDGVLVFTAARQCDLDLQVKNIVATLGRSVTIIHRIDGIVRPGAEEGHEHFGFLDGISVPTLIGFNDANRPPGESAINPNIVLTGQDVTPSTWVKDGSFLVFRELQQLVPEFQGFLDDVALSFQPEIPRITPEVVGARVVGRWKSGAPVVLAPVEDDPVLGRDPQRNHNFDFSNDLNQEACPYASHIRKTAPRNGTAPANIPVDIRHIIRNGIPYGDEVTAEERENKKTTKERGLLFACYQSSIEQGFQFLQRAWANNPAFPFNNSAQIATPGFDLIIGQTIQGARTTQGIKPNDATDPTNVISAPNNFVVPRGGEYFFVPSLDALANKLGA